MKFENDNLGTHNLKNKKYLLLLDRKNGVYSTVNRNQRDETKMIMISNQTNEQNQVTMLGSTAIIGNGREVAPW